VVGLDDSARFVHTDHALADAPPAPAFVSAQPCSTYWGEKQAVGFTNPYGAGTLPYAPCGYTPAQIKGAYGISGFDGAGQTVAIIDAYASPTITQDVNQWSTNRGLPTLTTNQLTQVVAPGTYHHPERGLRQDPQGWYGEETLDVEAVHGMAPAAKVIYVGAPNNFQDLDAALNDVVVDGHRLVAHASRVVCVWVRGRRQPPVRRAQLSAGHGSRGGVLGAGPDRPRRAGHLRGRRSEHRLPGGTDADIP